MLVSEFELLSFVICSLDRGKEHGDMGGNRCGSRGRGRNAALGTSDKIDTLGRLL